MSYSESLHGLHVILALLFVEFALFLGGGILVLLVLGHKVVHVGLRLRELHLVHPLPGVPMQERLAAEHAREVLGDTLEHLLNRGRIPRNPQAIFNPLGGISQTDDLMLLGIHSTKYEEFLFCTSSICWVSSGTVSARYCWEPRDVRGENPVMKKCRRGNGIMFTATLRRSQFS